MDAARGQDSSSVALRPHIKIWKRTLKGKFVAKNRNTHIQLTNGKACLSRLKGAMGEGEKWSFFFFFFCSEHRETFLKGFCGLRDALYGKRLHQTQFSPLAEGRSQKWASDLPMPPAETSPSGLHIHGMIPLTQTGWQDLGM